MASGGTAQSLRTRINIAPYLQCPITDILLSMPDCRPRATRQSYCRKSNILAPTRGSWHREAIDSLRVNKLNVNVLDGGHRFQQDAKGDSANLIPGSSTTILESWAAMSPMIFAL